MKQFLKKIFFLALIVVGFIAFTFSQVDGRKDQFYLRLISSKQHSLILGTSRGAQGIKPHTIDSVLGHKGLFNYAFTLGHSPYGKVYYESVAKKLISPPLNDQREGLFILEVSPWSIGSESDDETEFAEEDRFLGELHSVSCNPNLEYLLDFYPNLFIHIFYRGDSTKLLHDNGWLEVTIPMNAKVVDERVQDKMNNYGNNMFPRYRFSETRYRYLKKTVELLQKRGRVFSGADADLSRNVCY